MQASSSDPKSSASRRCQGRSGSASITTDSRRALRTRQRANGSDTGSAASTRTTSQRPLRAMQRASGSVVEIAIAAGASVPPRSTTASTPGIGRCSRSDRSIRQARSAEAETTRTRDIVPPSVTRTIRVQIGPDGRNELGDRDRLRQVGLAAALPDSSSSPFIAKAVTAITGIAFSSRPASAIG